MQFSVRSLISESTSFPLLLYIRQQGRLNELAHIKQLKIFAIIIF